MLKKQTIKSAVLCLLSFIIFDILLNTNVLKNHIVESVEHLLCVQNHFTGSERLWKLISGDPETILSSRSALLQKQALELEPMFDFDLGSTVHSCRGNTSIRGLSSFCELHCGGVSSKSHCMNAWTRRKHWRVRPALLKELINFSIYDISSNDIKLYGDARTLKNLLQRQNRSDNY